MIQPTRGRILVAMLPKTQDLPNSHGLTIVDQSKHYQGSDGKTTSCRRGRVEAVGRGVRAVEVGDIVLFRADAGFTLDYDPEQNRLDESVYRWLKEADCMALEEAVAC